MKIGVLSDTHIPLAAADLPEIVYQGLKGVDMILHCGDLVDSSVLDKLNKIAPTKAVCGNMDSSDVCSKLPKKEIVTAEKVMIGLIHGWGPPSNLINLVKAEFKSVDIIAFGHSHAPVNKVDGGILFFNPGTPTDKIFASYNSYGILEIEGKKIKGAIIRLD